MVKIPFSFPSSFPVFGGPAIFLGQSSRSDFDLIGFDESADSGPFVNPETRINFLTKRKKEKADVNENVGLIIKLIVAFADARWPSLTHEECFRGSN